MEENKGTFSVGDYDCVGFDLDNTLCEYNVFELCNMEYNCIAEYLVKEKGYISHNLLRPLEEDIDFVRKGLILDCDKGNILDISYDGTILKATHGTHFLTNEEIVRVYGKDRKWIVTDYFVKNFLETWNGPLSYKMRSLLDYFDIYVSLLFARLVDSLDCKNGGTPLNVYHIWDDINSGLWHMFKREHFAINFGRYFSSIKATPEQYIEKRSDALLNWLKMIKESGKLTFLITGSSMDYAHFIAQNSLGDGWQKYFDVVIYYARKPGFFLQERPFFALDGLKETNEISSSELKLGNAYSQGNWKGLYELFCTQSGKPHLKCVYFGDNLIQDIYAPKLISFDTVAVIKELAVEMPTKYATISDVDKKCIVSQAWGSYFYDTTFNKITVWGKVISKYSKICVPNLNIFLDQPLNFIFQTYCTRIDDDRENIGGYFPSCPQSLKK